MAIPLVLVLADPACCQDPPGTLPDLVPGIPIQAEITDADAEVVTDVLTGADLGIAVRGKSYSLVLPETGNYHIDLHSHLFNAYLVLRDDQGTVVAENNDGWMRSHARIEIEILEPGTRFQVDACAIPMHLGAFTLTVRKGVPPDLDPTARDLAELEDAREAVAVSESVRGPEHVYTARCVTLLAVLYSSQGLHEEALPYFQRSAELWEHNLGPEDLNTATSWSNLAKAWYYLGQLERALPLMERALPIYEAGHGAEHPATMELVGNLGAAFASLGRQAEARPLLERSLRFHEEAVGPEHLETGRALGDLGMCVLLQRQFDQARPLLERSLAIKEVELGPDHPDTAEAMRTLGYACRAQRDLGDACDLFTRAAASFQRIHGEDHPDTFECPELLGEVLHDLGRLTEAGEVVAAVLRYQESVLGPDDSSTLETSNRLATVLRESGEWAEARQRWEHLLQRYEALHGPDHVTVAGVLSDLSDLLMVQGNLEDARPLVERALRIHEQQRGPNHDDTMICREQFAILLVKQGLVDEARTIMERAVAVSEQRHGADHEHLGATLNNLAMALVDQGSLDEAEPLLARSVAILERHYGPQHPRTASALSNQAYLFQQQGRNAEARPLFERALAIRREVLGMDHPQTLATMDGLAHMELALGERDAAMQRALQAVSGARRHLDQHLASVSERERFLWAEQQRHTLDHVLAWTVPPTESVPVTEVYGHVLALKGLVSRGLGEDRAWLHQQSDSDSQEIVERLQLVLGDLSALFTAEGGEANEADLAALRAERQELETRLARLQEGRNRAPDLEAVQAACEPGEALVDFLFYTDQGARHLSAFVVRADAPLQRVELGEESDLREALVRHLREVRGQRGFQSLAPDQPTLRERLWEPLEPHLDGATRVFLCPEGVLATVPFGTLPGATKGTYLLEERRFVYLQSPADRLRVEGDSLASGGLLIAGGIDFDATESGTGTPAAPDRAPEVLRAARSATMLWRPLRATGTEAEDLAFYFERTHPEAEAVLLMGGEATEERIKEEVAGRRFVHLATHGHFAPELENTPAARWNPGLLSWLVLAGANDNRSGAGEDGILTAEEALWLDLGACELVTLSACETGLGTDRAGEQLQGLRRALRLAGARATITSLWKVDDGPTQELMQEFYRRLWVDGQGKSDALHGAQLWQLERNRAQYQGEGMPGTWGAFVLEGDWR